MTEKPSRFEGPKPPIPDPLRGSETGTFTHESVAERLPAIGWRTLQGNEFPPAIEAKLNALVGEIPHGLICPLGDRSAPDSGDWSRYIQPYTGQNWLQVPWFFTETYFYRRFLDLMGYFQPGPGHGIDPFLEQKRHGLSTSGEAIQALVSHLDSFLERSAQKQDEDLAVLLRMNLWGNQADLSMWPAGDDQKPGQGRDQTRSDRIVVDHVQRLARFLSVHSHPLERVDFLMDNAGLELVNDLALADYLLDGGFTRSVRLHLKSHPTFVSDAMIKDVQETIAHLVAQDDPAVSAFGKRLRGRYREGRLQLVEDFFWTSPLALWEMPEETRQELASTGLIISKGDANYRRLLGDRHWPYTLPVENVLRYLPVPLVAIRVYKSEVAIGLEPGQLEDLNKLDPEWLFSGEWGMIQFFEP